MPEPIENRQVFSLLEVSRSIERTLSQRYGSAFWVKAEMNKLQYYRYSGHCYPDLVEKQEGKVVAQMRANLWKSDFERINKKFLEVLKEPLKDGIKILFQARVSFTPTHGLALQILDIDPWFTLGDLEREKQETLSRLKDEGIFQINRQLRLPMLPQRIAIISVETSKGYADFTKVIDENRWGYRYFHLLFPSLLQGDAAVDSILGQLYQIRRVVKHFDLVAIIRGGGGDVGLTCYNSYLLAREVALFPLPVLSGIGHSTNETVVEMVANHNAQTPTGLAEYLLQQFHNAAVPMQRSSERLIEKARQKLQDAQVSLKSEIRLLRPAVAARVVNEDHRLRTHLSSLVLNTGFKLRLADNRLGQILSTLGHSSFSLLKKQAENLNHSETAIRLMHPEQVLKRGYSITYCNGKALKKSDDARKGDTITTQLYQGEIISIVNQIKTESNEQTEDV
jgi:exodeoxyribonuclease VII large subunit